MELKSLTSYYILKISIPELYLIKYTYTYVGIKQLYNRYLNHYRGRKMFLLSKRTVLDLHNVFMLRYGGVS